MPNATTREKGTSYCFQELPILARRVRYSAGDDSAGCYGTIIGKRHEGLGLSDSGIQTTGLYLCGFLTGLLTLLKILGTIDLSWWRIGFPLGAYLGFQVSYIATGFIYFSQASIEERLPEEEAESLAEHNDIPYFWLAWLHFVLFAVGVTEWAEPSGIWHGFWHAFGSPGVMIAFGILAELNLFFFWSSIGSTLNGRDNPLSTKTT
jgi:hypothetical protein